MRGDGFGKSAMLGMGNGRLKPDEPDQYAEQCQTFGD